MAEIMMNSVSAELSEDELKELELAEKKPIVYDEDCPEMTEEMLRQFHRMDSVMIKVSPSDMKKVRSLGGRYSDVLSRLLSLALGDAELVRKSMV